MLAVELHPLKWMLALPIALLLQAPKLGSDQPKVPHGPVTIFFICAFVVLLAIGLIWAVALIVRTLRGRPKDTDESPVSE